jgi:hypothetical protein
MMHRLNNRYSDDFFYYSMTRSEDDNPAANTLEEAIRKMTGTPEATTCIQSRGTSPEAPNK